MSSFHEMWQLRQRLRFALGATRCRLRRMVLGRALSGAGAAAGLLAAVPAWRASAVAPARALREE